MSEPIAFTNDQLISVLTDAIDRKIEIPEEFEPFVHKLLPTMTAASAKFRRRHRPPPQGAFGPLEGRGVINEGAGLQAPRMMLQVPRDDHPLDRPGGPRPAIPNGYRGDIDLDAEAPKLKPKWWWHT